MMRFYAAFLATTFLTGVAGAQTEFAVASIRPATQHVQFEHDGRTDTTSGTLRMRDVTLATCIKWAYGVQDSQISGPSLVQSERFDITARADAPATDAQMKRMLQALLTDRFKLAFHRQPKELHSFLMVVDKGGSKMHPSTGDGELSRQNSANGTVAKFMTMKELADFLSGPLQTPIVDRTGLAGKYDFTIDFTPYLPQGERVMQPDLTAVLISALQGELGIRLESQKSMVDVMMIDHVEKPSEN